MTFAAGHDESIGALFEALGLGDRSPRSIANGRWGRTNLHTDPALTAIVAQFAERDGFSDLGPSAGGDEERRFVLMEDERRSDDRR